jgi:rhodanese-related sulfurtransferase
VSDSERWFGRFGTRVLVVAKFVPGLGLISSAMAGVARAGLEGFVLYDTLGSLLWVGTAVGVGILFHDAVAGILRSLAELGYWGVALVCVAVAAFAVVKLLQRHALIRELGASRISVLELKGLVDSGGSPVIIDALAPSTRSREGMIPGAICVEELRLDSGSTLIPRDAEVIVYCACPNEASAARIAQQLIRLGCARVRPLTGGIYAWKEAGFEVQLRYLAKNAPASSPVRT